MWTVSPDAIMRREKEDYRYYSLREGLICCSANVREQKYCIHFKGNPASRSFWSCENKGLSGNCLMNKPITGGNKNERDSRT